MNNWDMLVKVVNDLSNSQGFYSRRKRIIDELDDVSLEHLKNRINNLPQKFTQPIDVIMFLEG